MRINLQWNVRREKWGKRRKEKNSLEKFWRVVAALLIVLNILSLKRFWWSELQAKEQLTKLLKKLFIQNLMLIDHLNKKNLLNFQIMMKRRNWKKKVGQPQFMFAVLIQSHLKIKPNFLKLQNNTWTTLRNLESLNEKLSLSLKLTKKIHFSLKQMKLEISLWTIEILFSIQTLMKFQTWSQFQRLSP